MTLAALRLVAFQLWLNSRKRSFQVPTWWTQIDKAVPGRLTGEMDPITAAVPEPSTWAMMLLGFASIGFTLYPRRLTLVCVLVLGSAVVLELLQIVVPDRDARVIDAVEKLTGGAAGVWAA